jgi:hypothetical protein
MRFWLARTCTAADTRCPGLRQVLAGSFPKSSAALAHALRHEHRPDEAHSASDDRQASELLLRASSWLIAHRDPSDFRVFQRPALISRRLSFGSVRCFLPTAWSASLCPSPQPHLLCERGSVRCVSWCGERVVGLQAPSRSVLLRCQAMRALHVPSQHLTAPATVETDNVVGTD